MTTMALNNLWTYLQGLTLVRSEREWLARKLLESSKEESAVACGAKPKYKEVEISPDVEKWRGCISISQVEVDADPRLKAILSR